MIPIAREALAARYRAWPSEELLRAVTIEPHEYTAEALELIDNELSRRNCSALQRQESFDTATRESDEEARSFTGVKGLLAFMVLVIAANSIAALTGAVSYLFQGSPPLLAAWVLILIKVCQGGFGLVVCALLISRNPRAPRYAATWFLLAMTISVAASLYSLYIGQAGAYPLSAVAVNALWLSYLSTSKRVKATYKSKDAGDNDASTPTRQMSEPHVRIAARAGSALLRPD